MSSRNGEKGIIHRVGGNYAIIITEDGEMFREWIRNVRSINSQKRTFHYNNEVSEAQLIQLKIMMSFLPN
jgi:hypothetical protein